MDIDKINEIFNEIKEDVKYLKLKSMVITSNKK